MPIVFLSFEFYISNTPFVRRQYFAFALPMIFFYTLVNMILTLKGTSYYPMVTWRSPVGIAVPLALLLSTFFIFKCMEFISRKKL